MNKNLFITSLLILFFINKHNLWGQQGVSKIEINKPDIIQREYISDLQQGTIGVYDNAFGDVAFDNVFHIEVPDSIHQGDKAYLVYDLYGISDLSGVSRSINDGVSIGGYLQKKDTIWHRQKEQIAIGLIQTGNNTIIFNAGMNSYPYKVKNVKLVLESHFTEKSEKNIRININDEITVYRNQKIYVKGFIENIDKPIKIWANSQELFYNGFEFEGIITKPESDQINIVIKNDNESLIYQKNFQIRKYITADKITGEIKNIHYKQFQLPAYSSYKVRFENAGLQIPDSALRMQKKIYIAPLRTIDIAPLESSMVNVTAHNGYRFLPDGTIFDKNVLIRIPYDPKRIPPGYTEKDIHSFYFDKQKKKWILLKKKEVDAKNHVIISYTNHFTDYINGIIKVPESPETTSFTPTMMSDIKTASPLEGITIINPPTASQKGDAKISYPIKIPAGRNGMQPSLSLQYSSNTGNGVLGEGWSLNIPAITLDTRWGVPRFDAIKETEMYMLNGEALMYPKMNFNGQINDYMPNRPLFYTDNQGNTHPDTETGQLRSYGMNNNIKIFYLRKQNAQIKIERIGDSPKNYYWKITGADGTISWYGWDEQSNSSQNYTIRNDEDNIVYWALAKQQDVYGNIVKYHYEEVNLTNTNSNLDGGRNFKIKEITYTGYINGNNEIEGNYSVEFKYTQGRQDNNISFRNGYKQINPFVLTHIYVKYNDDIIRSYRFNYSQGDFSKLLLEKIKEYDSSGSLFNENEFKYYSHVTNSTINYQATKVDFSADPLYFLKVILGDADSKIGVNETFDFGGKMRLLLGLELLKASKHSTKNVNIDFNIGIDLLRSQGKVAFFDINGDGLKDIVFYKDGDLHFYKCNQVNDELIEYNLNDDITAVNISNFLKSKGTRLNGGFEVSFELLGNTAVLAISLANTNQKKYIYITDGNGDGLPDIVKPDTNGNSVVYFNHIDSDGNVTFEPTSIHTENVIATGVVNIDEAPEDVIILPDSLQTLYDNFKLPNYDMVRVWVAPKAGNIIIRDTLNFLGANNEYLDYSIETVEYTGIVNDPDPNDDFEYFPISNPFRIFYKRFDTNNPYFEMNLSSVNAGSVPLGPTNDLPHIRVRKGQMIFFRIHGNSDNNKILQTNPYIFYDEDIMCLYSNYADSFVLNDQGGYDVEENQTIHFSCDEIANPTNFINNIGSDYNLKYTIKLLETNLSSQSYVNQYTLFEKSIHGTSSDNLNFNNLSDWDSGIFIPGVNLNISSTDKSISFSNVNNHHQYKLEFIVKLVDNNGDEISYYDRNVNWKKIQWRVNLNIDFPNGTNKQKYQVANHYFAKLLLFDNYYNSNRYLNYNFLGGLYGGWGELLYADNYENILEDTYRDSIGKLINHNLVYNYLNIDMAQSSSTQNVEDFTNDQNNQWQNELNGIDFNSQSSVFDYLMNTSSQYDFNRLSCYYALPFRGKVVQNSTDNHKLEERWTGLNIDQYSKPHEMKNISPVASISPLGDLTDYVESLQPELPNMQFDSDYGMLATQEEQRNLSLNLVAGYDNINSSWAHVIGKYSYIKSMFIDLNGDRYPDIIKGNTEEGFAYLTNMNGGHTDKNSNWMKILTYNKSDILDASASSNGQLWGVTTAGANKLHKGDKKGNPITKMGITVNFNLYDNNYNGEFWLDINGDGLPDKIIKTDDDFDNDDFRVKLNNGINESFLNSNNLTDFEFVNSEKTDTGFLSSNISVSINDLLPEEVKEKINELGVSAVIGGAHSTSSQEIFYADVNGDGLIDLIEKKPLNYYARINLGNKFSEPYLLNFINNPTAYHNKNKSVSLGANYTYLKGNPIVVIFGIPVLYIKYGISLTGTFSRSESNNYLSFVDINSDGIMDIVDNNFGLINMSNLSTSNKLKYVKNNITNTSFTLKYNEIQANYSNPSETLVLDEVSVNDGLNITDTNGNDCDGADTYVTRFDYENPHYDRREREFYGFEKVTTKSGKIDSNGYFIVKSMKIDKYYNKSYFLNGLLRETTLKGADNTEYTKTINIFKLKKVDTSGKLSNDIADFETYDVGGAEGRRQAAVLLAETFTDINDKNNSSKIYLRKRQKFAYDNLGRVEKVITYEDYPEQMGNADDYQPFNKIITEIYYDNNAILTDRNILNTPNKLVVSTESGHIIRLRTSEYDQNGNPIQVKAYYDTGSNDCLTTKMEYDNYGNLVHVTYPTGMSFKYTYDNVEHKYIVQTEDAFGYYSKAEYDYKFDAILLTEDITHNKTVYGYDHVGRLKYVIGPKQYISNNVAASQHTIDFEYYPRGYNSLYQDPLAITRHYDEQHPDNTIDTYTFTDGLGRVIQVKKDIEIYGEEKLTATGKKIYDDYGRIIKNYHPILQDLTQDNKYLINFDNSEPDYIKYTYDDIDRKISVTDEAGIVTTFKYGIESIDHFNTYKKIATYIHTISPQNSSADLNTTTYKDVNGNILATKVKHKDQSIWTYFEYNAIGEKLRYADDQNIQTTYQYDLLGRVILRQSPDYGRIINYYDNQTGNLYATQNEKLLANNQFIKYYYELGRLERIIFPQVNGNPNVANVYYKYGNSGNETGRLIFQQDATGRQLFEYGKMGEITKNTRFVYTPNGQHALFITEFGYDSWNRIQYMIYPDGEKVGYFYDKGGNLISIGGDMIYIKKINYDKYEQKTRILYGNGVETTYNYDPQLRRLQQMKTIYNNNEYLNINYDYDFTGNITGIINTAPAWQNITAPYQHTYQYDDINRLTYARGNVENNVEYKSYLKYNSTYGITLKYQVYDNIDYNRHYTYINNTHRLEKIEENGSYVFKYRYDLNGNTTRIYAQDKSKSKGLYWDEINRLRVVNNVGGYHYYLYDANGERIIKGDAEEMEVTVNGQPLNNNYVNFDTFKLYPSAYMVVNGFKYYTKHYFAGTQRILSRVMDDADVFFLTKKQSKDSKKFTILQQQDMKRFIPHKKIRFTPYKPADNSDEHATRAPQNLYYFHPNHLGTGTLITNGGGEPYQYFVNLPYGETLYETGGLDYDNPYKFNGKELDQETGLYYYGARYYDPETSIWLSVDPLAEKYPGINPYVYTAANPVKFIDPDGQCFTRNEDGFFVPCPTKELKDYGVATVVEPIADGTTRKGYFGYEWIMKDGQWQLNNSVDPKSVKYRYIHVEADGSPEYYIKRYLSHIENFQTRPPDYYLEYGYNNIILFKNHKWKTKIGKQWMEQTAIQLQIRMNDKISNNPTIQGNNNDFTVMAYKTHVPAYKHGGLLLKVRETSDFMSIPFIPRLKHSFFSWEGLKQIYQMNKYLGEHPANIPVNPLGGYMGSKL